MVVATLAVVYDIDPIEECITRRPEPVYAYTRLPDVLRLSHLGARISGDASGVTEFHTGCSDVGDQDLACLAEWPSLTDVSLYSPRLTGNVLKYLRPCTKLGRLRLHIGELGAHSFEPLRELPCLTSLTIGGRTDAAGG